MEAKRYLSWSSDSAAEYQGLRYSLRNSWYQAVKSVHLDAGVNQYRGGTLCQVVRKTLRSVRVLLSLNIFRVKEQNHTNYSTMNQQMICCVV